MCCIKSYSSVAKIKIPTLVNAQSLFITHFYCISPTLFSVTISIIRENLCALYLNKTRYCYEVINYGFYNSYVINCKKLQLCIPVPVAAHLLRLWVRIPPEAWMYVCCECCVLSGTDLCEELITRPEESYRLVRR